MYYKDIYILILYVNIYIDMVLYLYNYVGINM